MPSTHALILALNKEDAEIDPSIHLGRISGDSKGNTFLLHAIAWNQTLAAISLCIKIAKFNPHYFRIHDYFESSYSSAMILAAKTGNNQVVIKILELTCGKYRDSLVNAADYRDNTALHYACLMRNNPLIKKLLASGANPNLRNAAGYSPFDYYMLAITEKDLEYFHGVYRNEPNCMWHVCDWNKRYQGTRNKNFSNYRWYLPQIILNLELADSNIDVKESLNMETIFIASHFEHTKPSKYTITGNPSLKALLRWISDSNNVHADIRLHKHLSKLFVEHHKATYSAVIASKLFSLRNCPANNGGLIIQDEYISQPAQPA